MNMKPVLFILSLAFLCVSVFSGEIVYDISGDYNFKYDIDSKETLNGVLSVVPSASILGNYSIEYKISDQTKYKCKLEYNSEKKMYTSDALPAVTYTIGKEPIQPDDYYHYMTYMIFDLLIPLSDETPKEEIRLSDLSGGRVPFRFDYSVKKNDKFITFTSRQAMIPEDKIYTAGSKEIRYETLKNNLYVLSSVVFVADYVHRPRSAYYGKIISFKIERISK